MLTEQRGSQCLPPVQTQDEALAVVLTGALASPTPEPRDIIAWGETLQPAWAQALAEAVLCSGDRALGALLVARYGSHFLSPSLHVQLVFQALPLSASDATWNTVCSPGTSAVVAGVLRTLHPLEAFTRESLMQALAGASSPTLQEHVNAQPVDENLLEYVVSSFGPDAEAVMRHPGLSETDVLTLLLHPRTLASPGHNKILAFTVALGRLSPGQHQEVAEALRGGLLMHGSTQVELLEAVAPLLDPAEAGELVRFLEGSGLLDNHRTLQQGARLWQVLLARFGLDFLPEVPSQLLWPLGPAEEAWLQSRLTPEQWEILLGVLPEHQGHLDEVVQASHMLSQG